MARHLASSSCTLLLAALAAACAPEGGDSGADDAGAPDLEALAPALEAVDAEDLMAHVEVLASDRYLGRSPGTPGEDSTVAYLTARFRDMGLEPGNPDGSYVQDVPLVGLVPEPSATLTAGGRELEMTPGRTYVAVTRRVRPEVRVEDSEVVFVGYGVQAPEYEWDDFAGQDMSGKTLVMLVNDPPVRDPNDSTRMAPEMFAGDAMTYYGRWTYKYEKAAELGADAVLVVHETGPAGYPWEVVAGGWSGEQFDIRASDDNMGRAPVEGWITESTARALLEASGEDFEDLKARARSRDFEPVPLDATASFTVRNRIREATSRNVVARLPGSTNPDELVVYTAHWDHLGVDPGLEGDSIFNGALDNATGTAGLLELAEGFAALPEAPDRTILFLAVTAEEQGLLGAKYYATEPLYPLERTLANINIDGLNQWGPTADIVVVGYGNSTLDDVLARAADAQGRELVPDPEPEKGFFYRSDHFEFAKQGVPALYTDAGVDFRDRDAGWGEERRARYTAEDYHKPSDEIKEDWDLSGAVDDLRLLLEVGWRVAGAETWPAWKEGTEFKALREERLREAGTGGASR